MLTFSSTIKLPEVFAPFVAQAPNNAAEATIDRFANFLMIHPK